MAEFHRVEAGDIVVCPTTAAAWSPIFGVIGGLVTEHGGLLSHPAILAREYGLPAVLGVPDATRVLDDGARIEVDGGAGRIRRLSS
jgi:pyruvate,water dikinase